MKNSSIFVIISIGLIIILGVVLYAQGSNPMFTIQSLHDLIHTAECGNGKKEYSEQCDDGNMIDTDTCSNNCQLRKECPKEHLAPAPRGCYYTFNKRSDGCQESYLVCQAICGDGKINQEQEECDDGNLENNDHCSNTCKKAVCGDGIVQNQEQCDTGIIGQQCKEGEKLCIDCICLKQKFCGDGQRNQDSEECDDGNTNNDDGCSTLCKICHILILPDAPLGCQYKTSYNKDDCPVQRMVCDENVCSNGLDASRFPNCTCPSGTQYIQTQESCIIDPITEQAQCRNIAKCIQNPIKQIPIFATQSFNVKPFEKNKEATMLITPTLSVEEEHLLQIREGYIQNIMNNNHLSTVAKRLQLKRLLVIYRVKIGRNVGVNSGVYEIIKQRIQQELSLLD